MGVRTGKRPAPDGPGAVRRSLGRRLRALREASGKTPADVAATKLASRDKLWRIEKGKSPVKQADVRALCWLYGASPEDANTLAELALKTEMEGFWEDYSDVMPPRFGVYVELEAAASHIFTYDPELIHGLLQAPAYHRAVFEFEPYPSADSVDRQVELRAERQRAAFDRGPPLIITAILGEGAITRDVGGPAVMREQRRRLLELSAQANVQVLVLPWNSGAHAAMKGAFTVVSFDEDDDPDVVYLETLAGGRYVEQAAMIQKYRETFELVRNQSLTIEEYLK
jgi:transcriptional regulator with XRE-family HTH domain